MTSDQLRKTAEKWPLPLDYREIVQGAAAELDQLRVDLDNAYQFTEKLQVSLMERETERDRLKAAITTHHAQKADDLCWMDDERLHSAADLPPREPFIGDPKAMLRNCKRFIRERCFSGGPWVSYAELEVERDRLQADLIAAAERIAAQAQLLAKRSEVNNVGA